MEFEIGSVLEGKVTGITSFGAFVSLPENRSGLVHISEIANTYVSNIRDHLTEGQSVMVRVIDIDKNGRINLSIKKALDPAPRAASPNRPDRTDRGAAPRRAPRETAAPGTPKPAPELTFEDRLKQFMQDSDSKISGLKIYKKNTSSRRGGRK